MQHLDEVITAEIYARVGVVGGVVKRVEGSLETMGLGGAFFRTFFSLLKRKCKHSRKTIPQSASLTAPSPHSVAYGDISPRWGEFCPLHTPVRRRACESATARSAALSAEKGGLGISHRKKKRHPQVSFFTAPMPWKAVIMGRLSRVTSIRLSSSRCSYQKHWFMVEISWSIWA